MKDYGVPDEYLRCPGCGRTYPQCRTVCKDCDECKRCHDGRCEEPVFVKVDDDFMQEMARRA